MLTFILFVIVAYLLYEQSVIQRQLNQLINNKGLVKKPSRAMSAEAATVPALSAEELSKATVIRGGQPETGLNTSFLESFANWFKDDWLMKLGALFLLIGFGWLVTYAFLNNWIGPMGRILVGMLCGTIFLLLGWFRIKSFVNQGGVLLILGSSTILVTIYAARELYGFFNPTFALLIMLLSVTFVALAGIQNNNRMIGFMSLIMAAIVPMLTGSTEVNYFSLYSYLLVVVLGSLWVAAVTGWREAILGSLFMTILYGLSVIGNVNDSNAIVILFVYLFAALFLFSSLLAILKGGGEMEPMDMAIAGVNSMYLLVWILNEAPEDWKSLILVAWLLIFVVSAFIIFRKTNKPAPVYLYSAAALVFLGSATAVEVKADVLPLAYSLEVLAMTFLVNHFFKKLRSTASVAVLMIIPMVLSVKNLIGYSDVGGLGADFWVLLLVSACLLVMGWFFRQLFKQSDKDSESWKTASSASFIVASLYVYWLIWFGFTSLWSGFGGVMISLLIYTVVGITTYFYGNSRESKVLKTYGLGLLIWVIARMLLVDVWRMDIAGRIVTFFSVGFLLLGTALLNFKRNK
ncbi:hypothetical protein COT94_02410 [Candidatus Falkowbacteria bacterium CG10_big_fil_rev_8_21_14_0_10_37_14]|uniref:DUF2339 domain-containing protein n=1 Tax=Candidatus Falkowbacteria bacterium CG10_big_fil_rev_8_21_14_0_10_37_14 TaxID=1974561 RepID=A0A2M6WTH8_9BACT|nr:DUF2339 domain-containing protein [Candidatus Falkowbacteria bacterium]PIT96092.1 MAG: hypothetical protein COT94_02410 [Candidatus Falkowbacteria bacterium CG10_big_fil_rev_8_21_14_0_10_37_14]